MAAKRFKPAPLIRSIAPIHNSKSGFTGFLINTGTSTPFNASAISCTANGLAVVRAPIHNMSMLAFKHSYTCLAVATSVETSIPVSSFTRFIQARPSTPIPSNPPGLVRGFQIPARKIFVPRLANAWAVLITCSSVSALHGPAMTIGRSWGTPANAKGCKSNSIVYIVLFHYHFNSF